MVTKLEDQLIDKVRALPPDEQREVLRRLEIRVIGRNSERFAQRRSQLFIFVLALAAIGPALILGIVGGLGIAVIVTTIASTVLGFLIGITRRNTEVVELNRRVANDKPIWQIVEDVNTKLPADTWENVPSDGSTNLDHYLYGAPKQQT